MTNTELFAAIYRWINKPLIHIGSSPLTLGGVFWAIFIIVIFLVLSRIIQNIVTARFSKRFNINPGVTYAICRILHYVIFILGVLVGLQSLGISLGSVTVIFGFLGVGIGFGLQNITSNFVSGLVLLLERPISAGDYIKVDDETGIVTKINMRASIVETLDKVSIVVPNSKLLDSAVVNWSHGDSRIRIHCKVGIAYGSDTEKVKALLVEVARENILVLKDPAPEVRFTEFGDSSLNFDLLVWIPQPEQQFKVRSDLNFQIDKKFREHSITIPFPQRDLNFKNPIVIEKKESK